MSPRTRARGALLAALLALALLGAGLANASHLDLTSGGLTSATVGAPCPGPVVVTTATTTATSSSVTVTAPAACAGATLTVVVDGGSVTRQGTAVLPASGSVTVALDGAFTPSTATQVAGTADGWVTAVAWSYTPPPPATGGAVVPGNAQTVLRGVSWNVFNQNQACVTVDVSTNTSAQSWWRVDLVVAEAPFYGATTGYTVTDGQVQLVTGTAVNGRLGIEGSNNGWGSLASAHTRQFTVCHYGLPAPPDVPSAYTTAVTQGTWTDTQACLTTTVTGNGSQFFYFGWRASLDMAPAYQRIESTGRTVRRVQEQFSANVATIAPAPPTRATSAYTLASGWQGVLRLAEQRPVTVCAYEY